MFSLCNFNIKYEILWEGLSWDTLQLLIVAAESPKFFEFIHFSSLWQHEMNNHITWDTEKQILVTFIDG